MAVAEDEAEPSWLFRGVPLESPEVKDVRATGELMPLRLDRIGEKWREFHSAGYTETAYTSWTSDRSIAVAAAIDMSDSESLGRQIVVFRVPYRDVANRCFSGRDDESEFLIEGRVEGVVISSGEVEDIE